LRRKIYAPGACCIGSTEVGLVPVTRTKILAGLLESKEYDIKNHLLSCGKVFFDLKPNS
jgi:hypothetical protein